MKSKSLPLNINCNNTELYVCDYYMCLDLCKETCAYARDIKGFGVGALDIGLAKLIKEAKQNGTN